MNRKLIRDVLLVATREFRQITSDRSFWLTVAIIPILMITGPLFQSLTENDTAAQIMLINPTGREVASLRERIELSHQRDVLISLARYARRHNMYGANSSEVWARSDGWPSDADVQAFIRSGGKKTALAAIAPQIKPQTPAFDAPDPRFEIVPTPTEIADASLDRIGGLVEALINPPLGSNESKLSYVLYIPSGFGPTNTSVQLWTSGAPDLYLLQTVQAVLTQGLQQRFLEGAGVEPDVARSSGNLTPVIEIEVPRMRERVANRSVLPLITVMTLLLLQIISGSWMLQGLIEEKSNKLIETVLASTSPDALLYGKLFGTVAVGMLMIVVWIVSGVGAVSAMHGAIGNLAQPALAPLTSPVMIAAMIYFFLAGYLMISMIFLAIGAISESSRDAQNYMLPVVLFIMLPITLILRSIVSDTTTMATQVLTWLPIWTPLAVLARLGEGIPCREHSELSGLGNMPFVRFS